MTAERIERRYLDAQAARIVGRIGGQVWIEGGPGWTAYHKAEGEVLGGLTKLGYGRTKAELSAVLDGIETGLDLAERARARGKAEA